MPTIPLRQPFPASRGSTPGPDDSIHSDGRDAIIDRTLLAVTALLALCMTIALAVIISTMSSGAEETVVTAQPAAAESAGHGDGGAGHGVPVADDDAGSDRPVEPFARVDPTLPATPDGDVKRFRVDVYEHTTKVADDLPATRVWSYGVNGKLNRGTGVSEPMVVTEGDEVEVTLVNGADETMDVQFPHSIDYHSAEIAPNKAFVTIKAGETLRFRFTAKHPGVFMYHCATDPVLLHTGAGMAGMMIVKPKDLAPVDREFWITQQEFYLGARPGDTADLGKMEAKQPDAITFNGYADQYAEHPIAVEPGETIRVYVLNAGASLWSAFHVIGSVFDRTVIEGVAGEHAQTVNLAPSQGGWVEFTLDEDGAFPFVSHSFADMVKGASGVFAAGDAPAGGGH